MTGKLALYIRIALYVLAGALASAGMGEFDPEAGTLTLDLDALASGLAGSSLLAGALAWRGHAKRAGSET